MAHWHMRLSILTGGIKILILLLSTRNVQQPSSLTFIVSVIVSGFIKYLMQLYHSRSSPFLFTCFLPGKCQLPYSYQTPNSVFCFVFYKRENKPLLQSSHEKITPLRKAKISKPNNLQSMLQRCGKWEAWLSVSWITNQCSHHGTQYTFTKNLKLNLPYEQL